jgi:tellurite resistance protein TehA-like permease
VHKSSFGRRAAAKSAHPASRVHDELVERRRGSIVRRAVPVYFAAVMATGIVSRGLLADGWPVFSAVLLVVGVAGFVWLLAATAARWVRHRREVIADAVAPERAFGFLAMVAAANVLATRLSAGGFSAVAIGFFAFGALAWLVLGYLIPAAVIVRHGARSALGGADGSWFLWVVGVQSVVVAVDALPVARGTWLVPVAVACWSIGVVLYLVVAVLVASRLFEFPVRAMRLYPSYWVFMGATAISTLAGARIVAAMSGPLVNAIRPLVVGMAMLLWAFGTWTVPLLVAMSVWHGKVRWPNLYEPGLWSMVFPVGMYGMASLALGHAIGVGWLRTLGSAVIWAGAALWVLVLLAMLWSWRPARGRAVATSTTHRPLR